MVLNVARLRIGRQPQVRAAVAAQGAVRLSGVNEARSPDGDFQEGLSGVPTRAVDVAEEVLRVLRGPVNSVVLEKVIYYCQAWSLVWRSDVPLFGQRIEAWANGPVVPSVYACHRQLAEVRAGNITSEPRKLKPQESQVVEVAAPFYAAFGADGLITLSHGERPWRAARRRAGVGPGERSGEVISLADIGAFYQELWAQRAPHLPPPPSFLL